MTQPRYDEYRESGAAWLRRIPKHWEALPGRRLYAQRRDEAPDDAEQLAATQRYGVIPQHEFMEREGQKVVLALSGTDNFKAVRKDDFVISLRSFQGGIERSYYDGCVSPAYTVLRAKVELNAGYIAYLLKSQDYIGALQAVTTGIREGKTITYDQFAGVVLPVPAIAEQVAIARFLNRETARIDTLIARQERLIELLQEKRQALITRAVTKGLDPTVPMKHSGVEWLGEVPAHWEISKISEHFTAKKGSAAAQLTKEFCQSIPGEFPVYSGQTEDDGVMSRVDRYEFDSGSDGYLFSTTVGAKAMSVAHVFGKFSLSQNCMVIVPKAVDVVARFFYYGFQPLFSYERGLIPEHMQASFRMGDLYQYRVPVPPRDERTRIALHLDEQMSRIEALIGKAEKMVQLAGEHRSSLISSVVTGKIDVRKAA